MQDISRRRYSLSEINSKSILNYGQGETMVTLCFFLSVFFFHWYLTITHAEIVHNSEVCHPDFSIIQSYINTTIMDKKDYSNNISEVKIIYKTRIKASDRIKISGAEDAFHILYEYWDKDAIEHVEEFKILLLNRANMVLGIASLFKGGVVGTVIDTRVIFQYALKANAAQIILAHNHPSGNLKPSDADLSITKKINEGARHLDITVLDHIILTGDGEYYSFAEEGDL
jgi:DNA repair protein RadC